MASYLGLGSSARRARAFASPASGELLFVCSSRQLPQLVLPSHISCLTKLLRLISARRLGGEVSFVHARGDGVCSNRPFTQAAHEVY